MGGGGGGGGADFSHGFIECLIEELPLVILWDSKGSDAKAFFKYTLTSPCQKQ